MDDMIVQIPNTTFQFSAVAPEKLENLEYTLVPLVCDISGSVSPYAKELEDCLNTAISACRANPRSENIMIRAVSFADQVKELIGFTLLNDTPDFTTLFCGGGTALYDAVFSSFKSMTEYANILKLQDYAVNGIMFIITDGDDNSSHVTRDFVRKEIEAVLQKEAFGRFQTILIGVNDSGCKQYLENFVKEVKIDQYISMGSITPSKLAKLSGFISKSISSSSQSLATRTSVKIDTLTF